MSEQNKDKLNREDWLKQDGPANPLKESGRSTEKSPDDWEAIAQRGRSQLNDEPEAQELLHEIDRAIEDRFGSAEPVKVLPPRKRSYRWMSIAAAGLVLLLAAWWLWPNQVGTESLYNDYFTHLDDDLSVQLMGDNPQDELAEVLRPYKARRYPEATQSIGRYLEQQPEAVKLRLYYGISLLQSNKVPEAIVQFQQLQEAKPDTNYLQAADWYLALAYLRSDELAQSKILLQKIVDDQTPYSTQASAILERL